MFVCIQPQRGEGGWRLPRGRCGWASPGCGAHHSRSRSVGWDSVTWHSPLTESGKGRPCANEEEGVGLAVFKQSFLCQNWSLHLLCQLSWAGTVVWSGVWRRILRLSACLEGKGVRAHLFREAGLREGGKEEGTATHVPLLADPGPRLSSLFYLY